MHKSRAKPVEIEVLQTRLLAIVTFLEPLLPLANCHMVEYITDNLWETVTPGNIRDEVNSTDSCNINNVFLQIFQLAADKRSRPIPISSTSTITYAAPSPTAQSNNLTKFPHLFQFMTAAKNASLVSLSDMTSPWVKLQEKFNFESLDPLSSLHVDQFMTFKKAHEVKMMANVVATLANASTVSHIVDIGSGKGYLSSMLALHHGFNVLGIDSSQNTSHGAATRTKKLLRVWESISKKGRESTSNKPLNKQNPYQKGFSCQDTVKVVDTCRNNMTDTSPYALQGVSRGEKALERCTYKQVTVFVMPNVDLHGLVEDYFPSTGKDQHLALVGLHTCGNLASTALRIFASNQDVKGLCNVGCCYHLLSEEFVFKQETLHEQVDHGFPMSDFLRSRQFALGRNARMLAAQSLERIMDSQNNNQSLDSLFYRALLQVLLKEKLGSDCLQGQVGRLAAKCSNFSDYVCKALKKLGLNIEVSEDEIESLYTKHIVYRAHLEAFFMLRLILAPVVECIILLDRLLFLLEQDVSEAYLVPMFDPLVSPRCYGIVALKNLREGSS